MAPKGGRDEGYMLYLYQRWQGEDFVVIVSPGEDPHQYETDGYKISEAQELHGQLFAWPTDRPLVG